MKWDLIYIPLITTILTTIVLYIKENMLSKKQNRKKLTEEKLIKLYNELYSISLKYSDKLASSFYITKAGMFELNGDLVPEKDTLSILDSHVWNELIEDIRVKLHDNLHLLEREDLIQWNLIEMIIREEEFNQTWDLQKYKELEVFFTHIDKTYNKLFDIYHK
ncbi:hypothetical protein [Bacillus subtilis]|uniref:hypothetical protein n=1 Tax=Bacillus subtilis TaxID=1423 RepID=UPI00119670AE|nr:hypothetical protein [Bacillus subtilis]NMP48074.1 hypothetical protein [Bacillus subtilis]TVX87718.1 hypothetical protein FQP35_12190 [Bacillus subtilis]